jgi:hypothetical protein
MANHGQENRCNQKGNEKDNEPVHVTLLHKNPLFLFGQTALVFENQWRLDNSLATTAGRFHIRREPAAGAPWHI